MGTRIVTVPQMGEGLQEVRIVSLHRKAGENVRRDEVLYSMETDKATVEVESPLDGVLSRWLAIEGDVLRIGAPIANMIVAEAADATPEDRAPGEDVLERASSGWGHSGTASIAPKPVDGAPATGERVRRLSPLAAAAGGAALVPPRTRSYCRGLGIDEEEMRRIHAPSGKLMPADVDNYLHERSAVISGTKPPTSLASPKPAMPPHYTEKAVAPDHRAFIMRIRRSQQLVIPAVIKRSVDWSTVRQVTDARKLFGGPSPSAFQTFAFAVARSVNGHPVFRSTMPTDNSVHEYEHVNLGVAVGKADGQLNVAVVQDADALTYDDFVRTLQANIEAARNGRDQANESVQMLLTYVGGYEIEDAIPLLVAPAVSILFISSPFAAGGHQRANITLTFDHRLIQGIQAAEFLKTVSEMAANPDTWRSGLS